MLSTASLDPTDPAIAARLWNCDETAFCTSVSSKKLIVRRGTKMVHEIGGGSGREHITVQCAGSAPGQRLPPFILYKGKNMYSRWMKGGPAAAIYGISESGWMDASNFLSWFEKLFLPSVSHLTESAPVLLFLDGHHSHISVELIKKARDSNILILCLPPNTTHLLQPLDVGVFPPVKAAWRAILKKYNLESRGARVSKEVFPSLIAKLWDASFKPEHCKGGFRAAGLVPFSPAHVLAKLAPTASQENQDSSQEDDRQDLRKITCSSCGHKMPATPVVKTRIISYFAGILEIRGDGPNIGERNNMKVRVEGEAITSDEFLELLEKQKASKEAEKKQRKEKQKKGTKKGKGKKQQKVRDSPAHEDPQEGKLIMLFCNKVSLGDGGGGGHKKENCNLPTFIPRSG